MSCRKLYRSIHPHSNSLHQSAAIPYFYRNICTVLLNDLYTFTKITADESGDDFMVEAKIRPDHPIFEGHFPNSPILPGVCHMQMVVDAVSEVVKKPLKVKEGLDMKFTAVVDPREGTDLLIKLHVDRLEDGDVKINSITTFRGEVCFKFKGVLD